MIGWASEQRIFGPVDGTPLPPGRPRGNTAGAARAGFGQRTANSADSPVPARATPGSPKFVCAQRFRCRSVGCHRSL